MDGGGRILQTLNNYANKILFLSNNLKNDFLKYIIKLICVISIISLFIMLIPVIKNNCITIHSIIEAEFFIKQVAVTGDTRLGDTQILNILNINKATSLYNFDVKEARARLIILPWVRSVEVEKSYPARLKIFIKEREPYAVYLHNNNFDYVDNKGVFMGNAPDNTKLPIVEGMPNAYEAYNFIKNLKKIPFLFSKVSKNICYLNNRWDVLLNNNVLLKLPSENTFKKLSILINRGILQKLLNKNINMIDLRNSEAISVILNKSNTKMTEVKNVS